MSESSVAAGTRAENLWPAPFGSVLQKLVEDSRRYFGADVSVAPISQEERKFSTLLRVRVVPRAESVSSARCQDAFIKILKPRANTEEQIASMRRGVANDFAMTSRVYGSLAAYPGLTAVRPIACFPEELAIVTEEAVGTTLSQLLLSRSIGWPGRRSVTMLTTVVRRVGAWLRAAQTALPLEGDASVISLDALRTYLDRRLTQLEECDGFRLTTRGRAAIEGYRDRLISETAAEGGLQQEQVKGVWIHADFCPENVLVDEASGRITVLDFTMAKSGTIYHDVSHLFMQLELMTAKPWFRRATVTRLQHALLDAFEPGLVPERPLFALLLLQHVICHVVSLEAAVDNPLTRLYAARVHRRHRRWLTRVAGLDGRSWVK